MFTAVLFIILYLAGVPVSAGILGETYSRSDRILTFGLGPLSWLGVALSIGVFTERGRRSRPCSSAMCVVTDGFLGVARR